jgi:hypothetical protein
MSSEIDTHEFRHTNSFRHSWTSKDVIMNRKLAIIVVLLVPESEAVANG